MAKPKIVKCKGLYTAENRYDTPEGALVQATNVLILRDGVIEPRWSLVQGASVASGNVAHWHLAESLYNPSTAATDLYLLGRDTVANTMSFAKYVTGSGTLSVLATGEDAPDGYANYTTDRLFFDSELVNFDDALFYNSERGVIRYDGSTSERAGGYPCAISCFPRPIGSSLTRTGGTTVTVTTDFAHGYAVGLKVRLTSAGSADFVAGEKTIVTVPSSTTFTYTEAGSNVTLNSQKFAASNLVGSSGFMASDATVAYRAVVVEVDAKGIERYREVSPRHIVINASPFIGTAADKNVQLAVLFLTTTANCRVELYRTLTATSGDPGDEMSLVYSKWVSAAERSAGVMWITDIVPDLALGEKKLYTNETQEGFFGNHTTMSPCKTIARWGNRMVQANITELPVLNMRLLSTDSTVGLQASDQITIYTASDKNFTAVASSGTLTNQLEFLVFTGGTASTDIQNTTLSFLDTLNWGQYSSSPFSLGYIGIYTSGPADAPGSFAIRKLYPEEQPENTDAANNTHVITVKDGGTGRRDAFQPNLGVKCAVSGTPARASNLVTFTVAPGPYFKVGETVVWYPNWDTQVVGTIAGTSVEGTVTAVGASDVTISNSGSDGTAASSGGHISLKYRPMIQSVRAKNLVKASNPDAPEAFTAYGTTAVGSPGANVLKCVGLRDSLLVFKEDGLYRVTSSGPDGRELSSELLDPNAILWAKDSAVNVGTAGVIAWLREGVCLINEQGIVKNLSIRVGNRLEPNTYGSNESTLETYAPKSRRARAYYDVRNKVYELRATLAPTPSAPYPSDTNLVYCLNTDAWVEDDLVVNAEAFIDGRRFLTLSDGKIYAQNASFRGTLASTSMSGISGTDGVAGQVVTFTYTGTDPEVGATINNFDLDNGATIDMYYVLSASGGSGTAWCPHTFSSSTIDAMEVWNPIVATVEWSPITLAGENQLKVFREIQLPFGVQEVFAVEVYTSTDLIRDAETQVAKFLDAPPHPSGTNPATASASGQGVRRFYPATKRFSVPQQHRIGQQLGVKLVVRAAVTSWTVLGIGIDGDIVGSRVEKG